MPTITPQSQSQSHPRSPSTTSDENNTVTWEHLEHAPPAPPSLPSQSANAAARNNDNRSTVDNNCERVLGPEMHALSEAVHVEDVMDIPQGTGTGTGMGMGPGAGRAPAIRIYPPGDAGSVSMVGGVGSASSYGGERSGGGSTKPASFSGR